MNLPDIVFKEQNPYAGIGPVLKKVMIVCPVSLVNVSLFTMLCFPVVHFCIQNWKSEFYKWLGRDRIGIATYNKDPLELYAFKNSSVSSDP